MARCWGKYIFRVEPGTYLIWALSALVIPVRWLLAWVAATTVHELGHYILLKLFRVEVLEIKINCSGILMRSQSMPHIQHAICSLAGPFAGLILLPVTRIYPILATCLLLQSAFNLLPIYPLDGGVVVYELLAQIFHESVAWNCIQCIGNTLRLLIAILMIIVGIKLKSMLLFTVVITIFLHKTCSVKFPCKPSKVIVQ